jgi:hypothetical protein
MRSKHWRYFNEFGCVKLDAKTRDPIPGPDGQPQLQRFPINLQIGDQVGSMYGGFEVIDSEYNKASNENVIASLMYHAERIAPFAEFVVAPAFKVYWLDGKGSAKHEDTAEIYEMQERGLFYRTRVALFSAGRDGEHTRERFWRTLISTVSSEKKYLEEVYDNGFKRWSDIQKAISSCYKFASEVLAYNSSRASIAIVRGEIRREHIPRLRTESKAGPWAVFTYLWTVYADLACETIECGDDFGSPHPEAEDHLWFFYRVFFGVEGDKIADLFPGPWHDLDQMQILRANYLAPVHVPKAPVTPMAVRPMRATG